MARTGRPPIPIEVKRKRGTDRPDRTPKESTTVALERANGVPPVPIDLTEHGRAVWNFIWESPAQAWLSPQLDAHMRVKTVCRLLSEIHELSAVVSTLGYLISETVANGVGEKIVANPAVKMLRDAEKQLDKELSALGFDPTARARLGLAEVKRISILSQLKEDERASDAQIIDIEDLAEDA